MEADLQRETEQQKGNANEAEEWGRGESDAPHQLLQAAAVAASDGPPQSHRYDFIL